MFYYLNQNYGKVSLCGNEDEYVAIYNTKGKMEHVLFKGEMPLTDIDSIGYLTGFFGSSGYKYNEFDSWHFCAGWLLAFVDNNACYVVTDKEKPIVSVSGDSYYEKIQQIVSLGKREKSNNVFYLKKAK